MNFCRNAAVGLSRSYFEFVKDFYQDSSGNHMLEAIDEDFVRTPVNMYYKKVSIVRRSNRHRIVFFAVNCSDLMNYLPPLVFREINLNVLLI